MKVERIIRKLRENKTVSEIARDEKINRYSVALVKQTLELIEQQTEQQKEKTEHLDEINKLKDENKKLKSKISELLEQNKRLKTKINENESFLKCLSQHIYEFSAMLFAYAILVVVIFVIVKKIIGG